MITLFEMTALLMLLIILYIYIGYPLILFLLHFLLPEKRINKKEIFPEVSIIISCFNEEDIIREKLENVFELDYPKEKLDIIVVSDASTDRTDEIVREFADRGVRLIRQSKNIGKTSGLNLAVSQAKGEIIVFSDANAMYRSDAVSKLARNFNDQNVGYVVGQARYKDKVESPASKSESTYWELEIFLKKIESHIHSVVGGDGAIYAIRRELYEEMKPTDINDFVNPLQIILKGYRGVYETEAICYEESAGEFKKEFKRKIRIINRSFSGLIRVRGVLNPFKTGFFSLEIISHKLLRWFAPVFMIVFAVISFGLSMLNIEIFQWSSLFIILFLILSYIGYLFSETTRVLQVFYYPYYFMGVGFASLIGISRSLRGEVQTTWSTVRTFDKDNTESYRLAKVGAHFLFFLSLWWLFKNIGMLIHKELLAEKMVFWMSIVLVLYVYFGYPLVLYLLVKYHKKPVKRADIIPSVTLLICAYNEEEVIGEKIQNSFELDYPPEKIKIVIASDGSTDKTNDIVREYNDERLILMDYPERRGKISVVNSTVPKLESEIVVFSDANTMYQKDCIKKIVRNFNDPTVGGVSADVILYNEGATFGRSESLYYLYERWIQKKESDFGSIIGADGGMYAIRRELFVPPSANIILDDFVISMNVVIKGMRLVYEKDAIGHERSSSSFNAEFSRKSRVIAGAIQSVMQKEGVPSIKQKGVFFCYVSHKFIRWMIPVLLLVLLSTSMRLTFMTGEFYYLTALIAQILFYLLAFLDLFIAKKYRISLTSIPFYFCMVNGAALFGIYKGLFNKQSVRWEVLSRKNGDVVRQ